MKITLINMKALLLVSTLLAAVCASDHTRHDPFLRVKLRPPIASRAASGITQGWVEQNVDHFDPTVNATWQQQYFVTTDYYKPGGPAFLFIDGEEEATGSWLGGGNMMDLAAEHGAIAFELEHRYYGQSNPTENVSTENLVYLSSEQALTDIAYFVQAMNSKYSLNDTKWIAYGGSYGANLAAWARLKFPHLIHGAVASSAPVLSETNFTGYFEVVGDVIRRVSPDCYDAINNATEELNELLKTQEGADKVSKIFDLCEPLNVSSTKDVYFLQYASAASFGSAVQSDTYSKARTTNLCQQVLDEQNGATPLERYAHATGNPVCFDQTFEGHMEDYTGVYWTYFANDRAWLYQTCTEYGNYQTSDSANQPFRGFPLQHYLNRCNYVFGDSFNKKRVDQGVNRANILYGGNHPELSNVLFVYGSADPWHVLGVLEDLSPSAQAIVMKDVSHGADLSSSDDSDPPELIAAHQKIAEVVRGWVNQ